MSQKARRILGIYAAAAIAMLAVYSCVSHVRLENYRLIAKYSSQRAFEGPVKIYAQIYLQAPAE